MRIILLGLLTGLLLLPTAQAQQRLALVMGNANYSIISKLKNPLNDATDIAVKLRKLGFQVVSLKKDLNHQQMTTAIRNFGNQIKAGDIALFYYAGHGVQSSDEQNYLIPLKADIKDESDLAYKAINASWVLSKLQLSKPMLKIMILDACRDNPFRSFRSWRGADSRGLARMNGHGGTIISLAADTGQKASDGSGRNGLYTQELLKLLGKAGIQASQMFTNVGWKVSNAPNAKGQTPFLSMKSVPPFCFAGCNAGNAIIDKPKPPQRFSFEPEMKFIKGRRFQMGSPASEKDRQSNEKQHSVQVGDFWMAKTEVTVKQYMQCVKVGGCKNPEWLEKGSKYNIHTGSDKHYKKFGGALTGDHYPIIGVSWHNANEYTKWLSNKTNKNYRLPTEVQWEYAARGGTGTAFSFGNRISTAQANFNGNYTYNGSAKGRYLKKTARVGSYPANRYGLQDMHGNVWEWTCSAYDKNYGGSEKQCAKRNENRSRVLRGGSWSNIPRSVRSASRNFSPASLRDDYVGFRLSRTN